MVDDPVGVTLDKALGITAAENQGIAVKDGYCFYIYLPGKDRGIGESSHLPEANAEFAEQQETDWICYAWPVEYGKTGIRAIAIDACGSIWAARNENTKYSGTHMPDFDAAMELESGMVNKTKKTWGRIGYRIARDGQIWAT